MLRLQLGGELLPVIENDLLSRLYRLRLPGYYPIVLVILVIRVGS
jgi:hypothetical protein